MDDILLLRAAGVWHRIQWEMAAKADADFGPLPGDEEADGLTAEQQRALDIVGMLPEEQDGTVTLDSDLIQPQLNRAEVAVGYLFSLYGIPAEAQPASYPSTDMEPGLGPTAVMEVWDRMAAVDPALQLEEREWLWTRAALDNPTGNRSDSGGSDRIDD